MHILEVLRYSMVVVSGINYFNSLLFSLVKGNQNSPLSKVIRVTRTAFKSAHVLDS